MSSPRRSSTLLARRTRPQHTGARKPSPSRGQQAWGQAGAQHADVTRAYQSTECAGYRASGHRQNTPPATAVAVLPPSRFPAFLLLFAALLAGTAKGISIVAFPWMVLHRTGSTLEASMVAGAATVPLLFSTLIAGTAVDFVGRKRISMLSDLMSGSTVVAIPLLALAFGEQVLNAVVLAVLAALGAVFDPSGITARKSMLPEAAGRAGWTLDRTNGLYEAAFNVSFILGPGVGGLMIAAVGGINTMWLTAGAFFLSILAVAVLRLEGAAPPAAHQRPESPWSGMLEGVRFVWNSKVLRALVLIDMAINGLYPPTECVLFPKYFSERNEPAHLSWVLMALSLGGLVGALVYPAMIRYRTRRSVMLTAALTLGVCTAVIAMLPPLVLILLMCLFIGLVYGPIVPIYNYAMQTTAPSRLRGRVTGVMTSLAYGTRPLGFMLAGPLANSFGLQIAFLALAIPIFVTGMVSLKLPSLRELDHPQQAD